MSSSALLRSSGSVPDHLTGNVVIIAWEHLGLGKLDYDEGLRQQQVLVPLLPIQSEFAVTHATSLEGFSDHLSHFPMVASNGVCRSGVCISAIQLSCHVGSRFLFA